MQYLLVATVGCAFWLAHWWSLLRASAPRTHRWCRAVLPLLMLADLAVYVVVGRDGPADPSQQFGSSDVDWLVIVNCMAAFAAWCVLLVLDVPLSALARHRRGRRGSDCSARGATARPRRRDV